MKYLIYGLMVLAVGLMIFNLTKVDFQNLLGDHNLIPAIGIVAPLIVVVLLGILLISKKIEEEVNS